MPRAIHVVRRVLLYHNLTIVGCEHIHTDIGPNELPKLLSDCHNIVNTLLLDFLALVHTLHRVSFVASPLKVNVVADTVVIGRVALS